MIKEGALMPFLYRVLCDLLTIITGLTFRRCLRSSPEPHQLHFLYNVVEKIIVAQAQTANKASNIQAVIKGDWDHVYEGATQRGNKTFDINRSRAIGYTLGNSLPITAIWLASPKTKPIKRRKDDVLIASISEKYSSKRAAPGALRRKIKKICQLTLAKNDSRHKSKAGDIIYKGNLAKMTLSRTAEGFKRPCGAFYHDGDF